MRLARPLVFRGLALVAAVLVLAGCEDPDARSSAAAAKKDVEDLKSQVTQLQAELKTAKEALAGLKDGLSGEINTRLQKINDSITTSEKALQEQFAARIADVQKSVGLADESSTRNPAIFDGFVIAVNVSPECREVMNILGVDKFVQIRGELDLKSLETVVLPEKATTADERRLLILKAHENLIEIDKRNEAQFGAFLKSLSDELSKN